MTTCITARTGSKARIGVDNRFVSEVGFSAFVIGDENNWVERSNVASESERFLPRFGARESESAAPSASASLAP